MSANAYEYAHYEKYKEELDLIKNLPDKQRMLAESRFLLIKECEDFLNKEFKRSEKKFRKRDTLNEFCKMYDIHPATLYRHAQCYRDGGIKGLSRVHYNRKNEGPIATNILPIIRENFEPGKGYKINFDRLIPIFNEKGIKTPKYATFIHIVKSDKSLNFMIRREKPKASTDLLINKYQYERDEFGNYVNSNTPQDIKALLRDAFNVAIFKYTLIIPFLKSGLREEEKNIFIEDIIKRKHHPLPGLTIIVTRSALLNYISVFKSKGFAGLLPENFLNQTIRQKDIVWATLQIDLNNPLACLQQIKEILENNPPTSSGIDQMTQQFFDQFRHLANPSIQKKNYLSLTRSLTKEEIQKLEFFALGKNVSRKNKATAILMINDACTILEVIMATGRDRASVYRWLKAFKDQGIQFIEKKKDFKKNNEELRERKDRILKIIHHSPKDYGINRATWFQKDISKVYKNQYGKNLSNSMIRLCLKESNYSWRSASRVLISPDPDYHEKTKKVLDTLQNLGPNDAFFFIDEVGPYQVRKYGGRSLTLKGTVKTYPQFQKPKGRVTFIGALDAVKNQVIMIFSKAKDTDAVACLIKILYFKYHTYSNLFLTWDCASWHNSKGVQECLEKINNRDNGPTIKVVPLPKKSQFLNVIESVFSGLKKSVIFNSDYQSEYEMKMAIYRHFQERNEYFKLNPKRAGNKIWDKEYYDLDKIDSGIFKRM